ncbi:hypothetical protein BP6252_00532 [Coleophoma cylindrospora]|uniref:Uncharacterized protein n=1 Tax=Coleophoma cylindrospora TaxID=1849047 RepID=A0A3D8SQA7_9HELO|nr:hypothetical protein BP6252_00532 [Coleophoma cylindrospora]
MPEFDAEDLKGKLCDLKERFPQEEGEDKLILFRLDLFRHYTRPPPKSPSVSIGDINSLVSEDTLSTASSDDLFSLRVKDPSLTPDLVVQVVYVSAYLSYPEPAIETEAELSHEEGPSDDESCQRPRKRQRTIEGTSSPSSRSSMR